VVEEGHIARWLRGPVRRLTGFCALVGVGCLLVLVAGLGVAGAANTLPFLGSFGAGQFNAPRGVAVDGSSGSSRGDVYVADTFNQRVDEFNPVGGFILTFGGQVNETKVKEVEAKSGTPTQKEVEEEDVCTAASGNVCKAGLEGSGGGQFVNPLGVAVDPSSGDVYVADFSNSRIEKFGPAGEFLLASGREVDATTSGNICTVASRDTCQAGKEGEEEGEFEWAPAGTFIAVGATGTVYVGDTNRLQEFRSDGSEQGQAALPGAGQTTALAVDAGGDLYAVSQALTGVRKYSATGALLAEFDPGRESGQLTALAVQSTSGEVFVVDTSEGARIRKYLPEGALSAESQTEAVTESLGIAVSASGTIYAADTANSSVLFFGEPPREGNPPPAIDTESVTGLGEESATVEAQINPFFLETRYRVQYVPDSSYRPTAPESERYAGGREAPAQAEMLGGGVTLGDQPARVTLAGLSPNTVYHSRFVAESTAGTTYSSDQTFTTYRPGGFAGLPDERVYEQVSAQKKNGDDAGVVSQGSGVFPSYAAASSGGDRVAYRQQGPSGNTSSGADEYSVSSRNPTGWATGAVMPPEDVANGGIVGQIPVVLLGSADLSRFLFAATGPFVKENSLTTENHNLGLYRTRGNASEPVWLSRPTFPSFSEAKPEPGKNSLLALYPVGGSADLGTVYFTYFGTLVPEDSSRAPLFQPGNENGPWGFYEWKEGALSSAGVLPSDSPYPNRPDPYGAVPAATVQAVGGRGLHITPFTGLLLNEVSQDGSKAFFISPEPKHATEAGTPAELYVREQTTGGPRTVLVSRDELLPKVSGEPAPAPGSGAETAVTPFTTQYVSEAYVYASPDGSRAFFESMDKLAMSASGEEPSGTGPWTYEINFNAEKEEGKPEEGKLAYLPGVVGQIAASSQDGSSFIFKDTATGRFELWSGGPAPVEVASFSKSTEPSFEGAAASDGGVFVFNTNAVLKQGSQVFNNSAALKQAYRYDVASRILSCVSCAPAGAPQSPIEALNTHPGREIADEGRRVFFGTAAKLVGRDVNGVEDAYEWEQAGTGGCHSEEREGGCVYLISSGTSPDPSFYLENDELGNNVFFTTREGLVKGDTDESYDVHDARVNGGFPQEASPGECASSCRPPGVPPVLSTPLTTAFGPIGNLVVPVESPPPPKSTPKPLTRAQKLAKALRACAKRPKRMRASCRKQARRRYGAAARARKTSGSAGRRG
jgi:DNA-binding beta-propeller fold protein YncE